MNIFKQLEKTPALFFGLAFFLGIEGAIHNNPIVFLPLLFLLLFHIRYALFGILVVIAGFTYTTLSYSYVPFPDGGVPGIADIEIHGVSLVKSRFGEYWQYRGTILSFIAQGDSLEKSPKNVPIIFKLKAKKQLIRPLADCIYAIPCHLSSQKGQRYKMKLDMQQQWQKKNDSLSFAELRYQTKSKIKAFFKHCFKHRNSQDFLAGLATGEFNNNKIRDAFSRFGLVHLMAISGFHFSLFAAIVIFILRPFFNPYKITAIVTLVITSYFLFLGNGPSVLRAWMMILISFGTLIAKRPINSLNALGVALIVTLLFDPTLCNHIGFQFSFLITAAILFWCRSMERWLLQLFPKKDPSVLVNFTFLEKHLMIFFCFFRPIVSLNLVTTLSALPLSLYYFQKFPLLSFFYNLIFPLLVSLSLFLLIVGLLLSPISLISNWINQLNDGFTHFILNMTLEVPKNMDIYLEFSNISEYFLVSYYTAMFLLLVIIYNKHSNGDDLIYSQKLIF